MMLSTPDPHIRDSQRQTCGNISPRRPIRPTDSSFLAATHRAGASPSPSMVPRDVAAVHKAENHVAPAMPMPVTKQQTVNMDWLRDPPPATMTAFQGFVRRIDWEHTSVGPIAAWPRELKQMVRLIMADTSPMILYWGPAFTVIYNEAYAPLVGAKHPSMLGRDAPDVFPDFWDLFDRLITDQRSTGETLVGEASMLLMERHGFLEETYFDWKLIPIIGDDGDILGSYGSPSDLTRDIIGLRRTNCIKNLAHQISKTTNLEDLWQATLSALTNVEKDLPLVLLYSVESQPSLAFAASPSRPHFTCHLEGTNGVQCDHPMAKEYIYAQHDLDGLAPEVLRALMKEEILVLKASDPGLRGLLDGIGWQGYGLPSCEFAIVPVKVDDSIPAFFIVGLNPYRRYNELYHGFLEILGEVIAPQISKIKLSQEVQRRAEIARKAMSDFESSNLRFNKFAERSSVGLAVAGVDRNITYANDSWYKFSGMVPGTDSYDDWLETVYEEDIPLVLEWWDKVLTQKKEGRFQYRTKMPFRQGHMYSDHRTAICTVHPDLNEKREIESVMGLIVDISELKWIEEQLRLRTVALEESESKYRNYAEHSPLGIVRTDGEGFVQYGNDAWYEHFGFRMGEISGSRPWLPLIDDEYKAAWQEYFQSFQTDPGPRAIEIRIKNRVYTMQDGQHAFENGVYFLVTGYSEFRKEAAVDYIDFWVTGNISAQKMAAKILANKMDEAIRLRNHQERFIDMISHEIRNPLSAVLHCGEEIVEAMRVCLDEIDVLSSVLPPAAIYRKSTSNFREKVEAALEASNTIMYCVQHQKQIVDDVLTLSKLDADLLVVSPVPVEPMKLVRSALKVFQPELRMTGITLSITEDESLSGQNLGWILLDPNRYLQVVINLVTNSIKFTRKAKTRNISVTVAAYDELPTDRALGVQFVPRRYESVKTASPTGEANEDFDVLQEVYLSFSVRDSGKGLTKDEMARLFTRFSQASPKTHIEYGGSGLGLFISRQITEMLGGEIGMGSEGVGSVFAFYVKAFKVSPPRRPSVTIEPIVQLTKTLSLTSSAAPLVAAPEEKNGAAIDVTLVTPESPPRSITLERHILVVEDNLVNQRILCRLLRNRNFVVDASNHGLEALDAIRERSYTGHGQPYDAILCDIEMPVMDGIQFAKQVRSEEASGEMLGHVPIIGVTANVRSQQVSAAIEAGMDGVTTKPYRIDELIAHMERVCSTAADRERAR